ncbi:acetyltransferase component of pyruvate dehydrogenase complex [Mycobacterium saskatchewanense]|uniref:Dihydrolipoamide acetyltransferase component of pyruvate dehydrogenase complex n=1 Tax=Mycobacterium saskatchewanense TaxID=220927 RepID=A0AAJ3TUK9_9MYCO|nr:dihydrolipoamide acetyltransferase family protein [Mycobacterium saskatchewanense]ORW70888.1 branched-chain alpha-keto acid dehydrogenase subunit E2 [Mycobacterium saskatchewanense]BBX65801.1 acetyltransferase component of pyruvate dehydrogenase complex [Mycobacterium saskatchewanense]
MIEFTMPALGSDMDEGTLNEWLVKPGDKVARGQIVAVVETTKAAVEVECWQEGTVGELLVPVGETVQVGTPLAILLAPGERAEKRRPRAAARAAAKAPAAPAPSAPVGRPGTPTAPGHRRWVSPAARRLAQSLSVDLGAVTGTGPQGAVTINDVEHAAAVREPAKPATTAATRSGADRAAQMRKSIAAAMSRSKREIPHYYLTDEIVLEKSLTWLTARNAQRSIDERVLPAVLLLKAVGLAAQRFGEFNGFWREDGFEPATGVHVGVGISLRGGGLVAPAIHDVPDKKLDELMDDLTNLVARARSFSLRSSEMSDPTITVTNLGDKGVDAVFGVIYPPQVGIVGFGQPAQRVRVIDNGIRIVPTVHATLAADHRASDGHRGALFLGAINELLQQPDLLEK